jgi:hypothetical protein
MSLALLCVLIVLSGDGLAASSKKKPATGARKSAGESAEESTVEPARKNRKKKQKDDSSTDGPRDFASAHFLVHTDLADDEADELLDRLETMLTLISKYWGRPLSGGIEMFVVKDLEKWPRAALQENGRARIENGGGLTIGLTRTNGATFVSKAVVYAVANRGTPQHEAVHAYCQQTFGSVGPVWYCEGMAEMGKYWRKDNTSVTAYPAVIRYLRESEPKSLSEIVDGQQTAGDWRDYAWRWALCHLLASNTNYSPRFHALGVGLLTRQDVSFEQTYGDMAREISFEYRQFLAHLEAGYRADLCSWDWKAKFKLVKTAQATTAKIDAGRGWQPSRLILMNAEEYEYSVMGSWTTSRNGVPVDADGNADGSGRLEGVLMTDEDGDYQLGKPFDLGKFGSFTAPGDGSLYLRCREDWPKMADNRGSVSVTFKLKNKGPPLAEPKNDDDKKAKDPRKTK